MKLTIQIVNFQSRHYLERCLFSISENLPVGTETDVLILNNDKEPLEELAGGLKNKINLQIHELGENMGFGRAQNVGFRRSFGEYILFLNPDTSVSPDALQVLLNVLEKNQEVGIAGPLLVDSLGKIQSDCFGTRRTPFSEKFLRRIG